jgi:hypothetical protein
MAGPWFHMAVATSMTDPVCARNPGWGDHASDSPHLMAANTPLLGEDGSTPGGFAGSEGVHRSEKSDQIAHFSSAHPGWLDALAAHSRGHSRK